jgi:hypothetical protein
MQKKMYYGQQTKNPFRDPERAKKLAGISATANDRQPGGDHYKKHGDLQPWDAVAAWNLDFFQGNILKYIVRWRDKGGLEDLEKAKHYLEKYIEVETNNRKAYAVLEKQDAVAHDEFVKMFESGCSTGEEPKLEGSCKPLDATGDPRKGLIEVDGLKFDPQRNFEMIGGHGHFVQPDIMERSRDILERLKEVDEERMGEAQAHPEHFKGHSNNVVSDFTSNKFHVNEAELAKALEDVEPLDKLEDRLVYEPMAKEFGVSVPEVRQMEQDAKHIELPHVDGNGSPTE